MNMFLKLTPFVLQMMMIAEIYFNDKPKSGAEKKALVMGTAQTVIGAVQTVSKGGQKETWDQLAEPVSVLIDGAASIMFKE